MSESRATIVAAIIAGAVTVAGSGWSCWTSLVVQGKQTASDLQIAALTQSIETQRLDLEKAQGALSVQTFQDTIKARQEDALKSFLPDVLSTDKVKRRSAVVVLTALYPNECGDYFAQALEVAATLDPTEKPPSSRPYAYVDPTPHPLMPVKPPPASLPFNAHPPPTSAPVLPIFPLVLPMPPELLSIADAANKRAGKWTIRVSLDPKFPDLPSKGGAAYEVDLLAKKGLPAKVFKTPAGFVTTTGVYDSETEAKLALRAMDSLSGRSAFVVRINSLCEDEAANPICTPPKK